MCFGVRQTTVLLMMLILVTAEASDLERKYSQFCESPEGLLEIQAAALCGENTDVLLCGQLRAVVAGALVGEATLRSGARSILLEEFSKRKNELIDKLASDLHDDWRAPRKIENRVNYIKNIEESMYTELKEAVRDIMDLNGRQGGPDPKTSNEFEKLIEELKKRSNQYINISTAEGVGDISERYFKMAAYTTEIEGASRGAYLRGASVADITNHIAKFNELALNEELARKYTKEGRTVIYEPRVKKPGVDIANTDYKDLPPQWKSENRKAAAVVVEELIEPRIRHEGRLIVTDPAAIEKEAAHIHKKWLERNGSYAPVHQKLPYGELSEEMKTLDRNHVLKGNQLADDFYRKSTVGRILRGHGGGVAVRGRTGSTGLTARAALLAAAVGVDAALMMAPAKIACQQPGDGTLINVDSDCRPIHDYSPGVINFLLEDPQKQVEELKRNRRSCEYYKEFHRKLFAGSVLSNVRCENNGYSFMLSEKPDSPRTKFEVEVTGSSQRLRMVKLGGTSMTGLSLKDIMDNQPIHYVSAKLYQSEVEACCKNQSSCEYIQNKGGTLHHNGRTQDTVK